MTKLQTHRVTDRLIICVAVALVFSCIARHGHADATIHCTGTLNEVWLKNGSRWPLAIIVDEDSQNVCSIDRAGTGHDPLKPCSVGKKCKVEGIWRHVGPPSSKTFQVDPIENVESVD